MNGFRTLALLGAMTALFMGLGFTLGGIGGAVIALAVATAMNLVTYWNADRLVLAMHGAREVDGTRCPEFVGLVHDLSRRAGLPLPRVFVIDSPHPNAFATGRDPAHAVVAATTGLLGALDRDEIAAVMAHELGHIRNRDTLVMTMTATVAGAIAMLANLGLFLGHDRDRGGSPWAMLLAVIVAPFAAMIVQMAISRTREYGADRAGAEISGRPLALAAALRKLEAGALAIPDPVVARNPALAPLYIVSALGGGRAGLFATHPATADRIAALQAIAGEMGAPPLVRAGRASVPVSAKRRCPPRASALDPLGRR